MARHLSATDASTVTCRRSLFPAAYMNIARWMLKLFKKLIVLILLIVEVKINMLGFERETTPLAM